MARQDPVSEDSLPELRRLLTLKRHEIPPPGFFGRFSGEVMARIQAGDRAEARVGWAWILDLVLARPSSVAAGFGAIAAMALWAAVGLAPLDHVGLDRADFPLSAGLGVYSAAAVDWPVGAPARDLVSRELSALGTGSVAPWIVGRVDRAGKNLFQRTSYNPPGR